jgi:hypothetical protein
MPEPEILFISGSWGLALLAVSSLLAIVLGLLYCNRRRSAGARAGISTLVALLLGALLLAVFSLLAASGFLALMALAFGTILTIGAGHWLSWLLAVVIIGGALLSTASFSQQMLNAARRF